MPPPLPPCLAKRHFSGEGGGGVYFEPPRGRNFGRPAPFIRPPPREGIFRGVGLGVYKIWPRIYFQFMPGTDAFEYRKLADFFSEALPL